MIIDRLIVERYGHFERLELDLGTGRGGLTVIYGANEAGKSTLLQAVRDLFFGVDDRTPLAFRYDYKSILLRAKLRDSAGQRLDVERRKKRKASLRGTVSSQAGIEEIDDESFAAYFGGIKSDLYNALFGFSLDDLQRGADALESAGLREVLGGSALGGAGDRIAEVLAGLHREARDLYKTQGKLPPINRALRQLKETEQALRDSSLQQSAYQALTARLEGIRSNFEATNKRLGELRRRRDRAQLLVRAAADFRELAKVQRERELSVAGGGLSEDDARRVKRLLAEAAALRLRVHSLDAEIARFEERIAALEIDDQLLLEESGIDRLGRNLGHLSVLRRELPGERAALQAAEKRLAENLGDLRSVADSGAGGLVPSEVAPELSSRLRERTAAWREAVDEVAQASHDDQKQRVEIEAARLLLGRGQDDAADSETIFLLAELDEFSERRAQLGRLAAEIQRLEVEISAALDPFGIAVDAEQINSLELPTAALVSEKIAAARSLEDRERSLVRERERIRVGAEERGPKRKKAGPAQLAAREALVRIDDARSRRRSAWEDLRQAWLAGPERITELERYGILRGVEVAIEAADVAADHLREHADQLARLRAADLEAAEFVAAEQRCAAEETALARSRQRWHQAWKKLWSQLPSCPEPADALPLIRAVEVAREAAIRLLNARRREADLRPGLGDYELRLRRHLGHERGGWPLLIKLLRERAAEAQTRRGRRESTRERLAAVEAAREGTLGLLASAKQREARLRAELGVLLVEVGLAADCDPEQALRNIDRRALLREQEVALQRRREVLAGKEAELGEFAVEVKALLRRLGIDDDERPQSAVVDELCRRLSNARGESIAQNHARDGLAQRLPLREQAVFERDRINAELAALRHLSGVDDDAALAEAAEGALRRDALGARLQELQERVRAHLQDAGEDREGFERELVACDLLALRDELATLEPRLADCERQRTELAEQKGKLDQEIESLGGDRAARLGAEMQSLLAELRERVDRYVLLHLAHRILDAVTDRFAKESQPAILQQVSSLLARITGGRHLRVSADRQAETLIVHDASGQSRGPKELSTGTREQLFLALRLAYVLDYCDRAEALPVIIDDVLVNFDRERARLTLGALCEVARSTQVLLFTCHHHIVELTRSVAPEVPVIELPAIDAGGLAVDAVTLRAEPPRSENP